MSVTYDELTKTLTYTYVDDPIVQKISEFKEKEVHIINVKGSFTSTAYGCFMGYFPVYEINPPDSIVSIENSFLEKLKVKTFHIPLSTKTIHYHQPFDYCETLEEFTIDENHQHFAVVDGVLFSKDMKTIYSFPGGKKCTVYQVPNGVEKIVHSCFGQPKYLKHVIIPSTVNYICNLFYNSPSGKNVTIIKCSCENPNATIEWEITGHAFSPSNVIFKSSMYNESLSSDGKTLVITPMVSCTESFFHIDFDDTSFAGDKTLEAVIVESGIEMISKESFRGCSSLKRVSFSNTIKDINENAFTGCKLGFRSVYYSTDSIKLMLQHFSRYSLGLLSFTCTNNQRHVSFLFIACFGMSTP